MTDSPVAAALFAVPAAAAVLVLPGFALRSFGSVGLWSRVPLLRGRIGDRHPDREPEPRAAALVIAVAGSLIFVAVVGGAMLAAGLFSPTRLAVLTALAALAGLIPFLRWCIRTPGVLPHALLVVALASSEAWPTFRAGFAPAHTYQWFYWNLGRELSTAHGVPGNVLEWGLSLRWQPDYINFNLISQAYLGLMPGVYDPSAVAAWKLPLALIVLAMTFIVLRLWFGTIASLVVTAGLSATSLYLEKIGNNTPEALGLAFGLVAVWLAVQAIRLRRGSWLVLAAVTLGLTISVHAIAATTCGLLLIAATVIELLGSRTGRLRVLAALAGSAVVFGVVVAALGLALEGRSSPLGDAGNPQLINGVDPTYKFIEYVGGHFDPAQWIKSDDTKAFITTPWLNVDVTSARWSWLCAVMLVGVLAALFVLRGRARRGVLTGALLGALLVCGVLWFALRYDTYSPQHTGKSRFAQYLPLVYAFAFAAALDLVVVLLLRRARAVVYAAATVLITIAVIAVCGPPTTKVLDGKPVVTPLGRQVLAELNQLAPPGSVVVSNAATRGTFEYFTHLEDPLEGRQTLIEKPWVLTQSTDYLLHMHQFLVDPHPGQLHDWLGADWLVLARRPIVLGTGLNFGVPAPHFASKAGLEVVWQKGGVQVLRTPTAGDTVRSVGPRQSLAARFAVALLGALVLAGAGVAFCRRQLLASLAPGRPSDT